MNLNYDNCADTRGVVVRSPDDGMRRWEMGGDYPGAPGVPHYYPFKTIFAMFKGWEDGNGPPDCRSLYNGVFHNESYANFFRIQNG